MSLTKLLKIPINFFFKKDNISFLIVHRYDLGAVNGNLRYICLKPNASISTIRQKIWHLLDLPDFCDEVIILKTDADKELPLTELRHGNCPQHAFILEVWLPGKRDRITAAISPNSNQKMLTILDDERSVSNQSSLGSASEEKITNDRHGKQTSKPHSPITNAYVNKLRTTKPPSNYFKPADFKKNLASKISSSSIISRLHCRKSHDNLTNILLKIQSDMTSLSTKLSTLEQKIS